MFLFFLQCMMLHGTLMHTQFELIYLILLALILYLFCRSNEPDWKMGTARCVAQGTDWELFADLPP